MRFELHWSFGVDRTWKRDFSVESEAMACEFARRTLQNSPEMWHATRVYLWLMEPHEKFVAEYHVGKPEIFETLAS